MVTTRSRIIRDFNLPVLWQRSGFYFWCPLPSPGKWLSAARESQCSCLPPVTQQAAPDGFLPFLPCWLGANHKGKLESSWPSSPLQSPICTGCSLSLSGLPQSTYAPCFEGEIHKVHPPVDQREGEGHWWSLIDPVGTLITCL